MTDRSFARVLIAALLLAVTAISTSAIHAQQRQPASSGRRGGLPREPQVKSATSTRVPNDSRRAVAFTPEREAAALAFVRLNQPELLGVLEALNAGKAGEYQRAIGDLFWTSERLATIRQEDRGRYELALKTWQLESHTHLLASQVANQPADAQRLRAELELAVGKLIDAQLESSAYEVKRLEAQLRRAQDRHKRLAASREELVRSRLGELDQIITQSAEAAGVNP